MLASRLNRMLMQSVIHENNSFTHVWRKPCSLDNKHSSVFTRQSEISLCAGDSKQARTASGSAHVPDTTPGKRKFSPFYPPCRFHHGFLCVWR